MQTSYFALSSNHPKAVSIAAISPKTFKGREYKKLAPKFWFFKKYKEDKDEKFYTEQYWKGVLNLLNPQEVYNELGEDAVLLCWEGKGKFCHRHLVADWFKQKLGMEVMEL